MNRIGYYFCKKNRIKRRMMLLCIFIILLSNHVSAQWTQVAQDVFENSLSYQNVKLNADATVLAISDTQSQSGLKRGFAQIYRKTNNQWIQIGQDLLGEGEHDSFGRSLSISDDGSIVAIGAPYNENNYTSSGHVRVFQNIDDV